MTRLDKCRAHVCHRPCTDWQTINHRPPALLISATLLWCQLGLPWSRRHVVASTCNSQQRDMQVGDIPAEIDKVYRVGLSCHFANHQSGNGTLQLSRHGPDASVTDQQHVPRASMALLWLHLIVRDGGTTRNVMQCSHLRGGFGFAFGLKSGMRLDKLRCHMPFTAPPRHFGLALPGIMLHPHVAFRFRCAYRRLGHAGWAHPFTSSSWTPPALDPACQVDQAPIGRSTR